MNQTSTTNFWFQRLFRGLKIPFWLGAIIFGFLSPLIQFFDAESTGTDFLIQFSFFYFTLTVYMLFAAVYVARQSEKAMDLAETMGSESTNGMRRKLYDVGWGFAMFVMIETLVLPTYFFSLTHFELSYIVRDNIIPITFVVLVSCYTLWAFFYSMKSLYSLGRRTLILKPFAEDRTLGLKPFGNTALELVAVYESGVLVAAIPAIAAKKLNFPFTIESFSPNGIPLYILLALIGFVFFFLPLISFRSRLKQAKAEELNWIGPRYTELIRYLKSESGIYVDEKVVGSLTALDKIQRDVQQIHTWPFDVGTVTRLTSITILPLLVTVLGREIILILLHV